VNQKEYAGWAYPSDKVDYSLGERVAVHYDPIDPAKIRPRVLKRQEAAIFSLFHSVH
jgi:hypothetical protein